MPPLLCELCEIDSAHSFHHLIPRTVHKNKWFKRRYSRAQMQQGLQLCAQCHKTIHSLVPCEKELARHFNTRERLLAESRIARYVAWKRRRAERSP